MLELSLFQASGCFMSAAVAVFALPWSSASCQGLHATSPSAAPATPFEPASTCSCRPCGLG
jgi:hypothetical protein